MSLPMSFACPTRLISAAAFLIASVGLSHEALAQQEVDEFGTYGTRVPASRGTSRDFSLEVRIGPYLPNVDDEFSNGERPFEYYFGTKNRVAVGLEFDWLLLKMDRILRFGPGLGIMYTAIGADAFKRIDQTRAEGQLTSLRVMPHWAAAVVHVDALAEHTFVPVVITAKAGLAHALWWTKDVPRTMPAYDGTEGRGRSYGVFYALGAQLDLSFLDVQRRKRLDSFLGINNIYLFGEFYGLELNAFGTSGIMNLSDRSWVLGLAFDL